MDFGQLLNTPTNSVPPISYFVMLSILAPLLRTLRFIVPVRDAIVNSLAKPILDKARYQLIEGVILKLKDGILDVPWRGSPHVRRIGVVFFS